MPIAEGSPLNTSTPHDDEESVVVLRDGHEVSSVESGMTRDQAWNLYTSHFLSTWNIRGYEFAVIVFTATTYPETLIAAAIRGIARTAASICLSSSVGRWIDQSPDRLRTLLTTISINRITVISASVLWYFMVDPKSRLWTLADPKTEFLGSSFNTILKGMMFAVLLLLGIVEGLSASGNMLSMERDWVVTAAAPTGKFDLLHLNSAIRRIDLICKLIAPIMISVVISTTSVKIGVLVTGAMSVASWGLEIWCARRVWVLNPRVRELKPILIIAESHQSLRPRVSLVLQRYIEDFRNYFSTSIWIPSMALSLLHLSALSYGATFITFLLSTGISLDIITIARAAGSLVEISSTVVTPVGVRHFGKAYKHGMHRGRYRESDGSTTTLLEGNLEELGRTETGLERVGLWGLSWQVLNLVPVLLALSALSGSAIPSSYLSPLFNGIANPGTSQPLLIFTIFFFLSISRLGLWIYDLTTQQLTQTMTSPSHRSSFTGVEYSFVSFFTLIQHILTIVMSRPEQFIYIALMSFGAVAVSTVMYSWWVWKMRGHLVHWEKFKKTCKCIEGRLGH